jgi:hypothetical protein
MSRSPPIFDGQRLAREVDSPDPSTPLHFICELPGLGLTAALGAG